MVEVVYYLSMLARGAKKDHAKKRKVEILNLRAGETAILDSESGESIAP